MTIPISKKVQTEVYAQGNAGVLRNPAGENFSNIGAAVVGTVCGAGGYEKYHSVAVGTGECGDGQHICAGRAGDGGRADAVLSGGDVLFYGGNEV